MLLRLLNFSLTLYCFSLSAFTCNEGEFLDMRTQECQKCVAGTYSLGTGVAFDEWDSLPTGFISHGIDMSKGGSSTNCSKWVTHAWKTVFRICEHNVLVLIKFKIKWLVEPFNFHQMHCRYESAWRVMTLNKMYDIKQKMVELYLKWRTLIKWELNVPRLAL